ADDGEIPGHLESMAMGDRNGGGGHVVVARDDGRALGKAAKQALGGFQPRLKRKETLLDGTMFDAGRGHGSQMTAQAFGAAFGSRIAGDEADVTMAELDQSRGHAPGDIEMIRRYAEWMKVQVRRRDRDPACLRLTQ